MPIIDNHYLGRSNGLEIIFGERAITTSVYIKMEAHDPLLLSEGVCRLLGIISYHPEVRCSRKISVADPSWEAVVPMVKVQLIQSAKVLPQQGVLVTSKVEKALEGTWLLEPDPDLEDFGVCAQEFLLQTGGELVHLVLTNSTGIMQQFDKGTVVGTAEHVTVIP